MLSIGLRTKKITPSKTELYYYDSDDLAYVTDLYNKIKFFFVRDLTGKLLHMIDYTASPYKYYCYIHDVHGNVVALADENGNRVVNYDYDAWGQLINIPESVTTGNGELLREANPFRYSGYQFDPEIGLYYLKARYYTANLGRLLTRDTNTEVNLYAYCDNDPVNNEDLDGEQWERIAMAGVGTIGILEGGGLAAFGAAASAALPAILVLGGLTKGRSITDKQAVARLRKGLDVSSGSRKQAKKLQKKASQGKRAIKDPPHQKGYRLHFYDRFRTGGHSFY